MSEHVKKRVVTRKHAGVQTAPSHLPSSKAVNFPFPPMAAPRPRLGKSGKFYSNSARYAEWKRNVRALWGDDTPRERVWVGVQLYEYRSNSDPDNILKSVLDALSGLAFVDDSCKHIKYCCVMCDDTSPYRGFMVVVEEHA